MYDALLDDLDDDATLHADEVIDEMADDAIAGFGDVDDDLIRDVPDHVADLDELDLDVMSKASWKAWMKTRHGRTTRCACT